MSQYPGGLERFFPTCGKNRTSGLPLVTPAAESEVKKATPKVLSLGHAEEVGGLNRTDLTSPGSLS